MREQNEEYARPAQPPDTSSLATMREAAAHCTACHLYNRATQTVFGEGPKRAAIMLIGEQPGDYEDVAGKPFVGPAGKIMDRALAEAVVDRSQVYVTNAVKHFKWEPRGKRRIHQKPNSREIAACRPSWKRNCGSLSPTSSWQWERQRRKPFSARDSELPGSGARCCPRNSHRGCSRRFIHHRFCANPTRNRANANTSISSPIFGRLYAPLAKNKFWSFADRCVSRFVF
jgi:hypothetical protein